MKNEKIVKVLEVVVQVCNIATIVAKTLIPLFPVKNQEVTNEDTELIKQFLAGQGFVK